MSSPNFFLAGVAKAGTSTLHAQLTSHEQIFMSEQKELHYYCKCPERLKTIPNEEAYLGIFAGASPNAMIVGEASPCYSYYDGLMESLSERWTDARILMSLRDPVDRFWSHYLMNAWYHDGYPDPHEVIDAWQAGATPPDAVEDIVGSGMYGSQLSRVFSAFDPELVMITTLEDLSSEPESVLSEILDFLGIENVNLETSVKEKAYAVPRNQVSAAILHQPRLRRWAADHVPAAARRFVKYRILGDVTRKPEPPEDLIMRLRDLYSVDVEWTSEILRRPLPWRHFPLMTER